jgi:hypothetical protein
MPKSSKSRKSSAGKTARSSVEMQAKLLATEIMERREAARATRAAALTRRKASTVIRTEVTHRLKAIAAAPVAATAALTTAGYLVAVGDSWFAYPIHNVLTKLEDNFGYNVESTAHNGDPIEYMVSHVGQLDKFARLLDKIKAFGATPHAVLISGGGDDVAGAEFGMLINNFDLSDAGWNQQVLAGVIDERVATAYRKMFLAVNQLCQNDFHQTLPILVHGYDYPVPDGRGFLGGWGPFPGPWLKPGFDEKLFTNLQQNIGMMKTLIDRFNAMLQTVAKGFSNVNYIDLRGTLSNGQNYKAFWANELHPTGDTLFGDRDGFLAVAKRFEAVLSKLPVPPSPTP